ncbi:hypothetical protein CONCODRAFT_69037 [Conidiobolus coronatus NRRL 28638]|uniref:Transmembrane protein n=1 Tax=Conidiobolus coronatus (strain ATCC 28846 / CBS 209.66 / NRRL 28638) TaxID=796925 RepID=A0A137PBU3_CONC2|nr:hypothetical protein CONCODRAFT_69037 [Conidiobolus coronatus NRRL 28638]|eukprot:KXN72432.1 hypothetical protein CONCODRAFT_69037 [Conidiobolus coronatus NRRL 28638]
MNAVQLSNFNTREKHIREYFQFVILALILINLIIVIGQLAIKLYTAEDIIIITWDLKLIQMLLTLVSLLINLILLLPPVTLILIQGHHTYIRDIWFIADFLITSICFLFFIYFIWVFNYSVFNLDPANNIRYDVYSDQLLLPPIVLIVWKVAKLVQGMKGCVELKNKETMCELLNENTQLKSNNKQKNSNIDELRKELERKEKYILQLELTLIHSNEHELVTSSQLNSGLDIQKEISMLSQHPRL